MFTLGSGTKIAQGLKNNFKLFEMYILHICIYTYKRHSLCRVHVYGT